MTSIRTLIESKRAELPAQPVARWASIFFSLSVLTFLISLAASQAFLALAGLTYAVHVVRGQVVPLFPPIKLPLALFCLFSTLSIFWAENRNVGWFAVRKLVLFLILLLAVNLIQSASHLKTLFQALFLESAVVGVISAIQFAIKYHAQRALHPHQVYVYLTAERVTGLMGHWMNFGGQQMLVFVCLAAFLLVALRARANNGGQRPPLQWFWWLISLVVAASIILNFTRGVWLGAFTACVYLVARWRPRWLWALPVLMVAGYFVAPGIVRKRLDSVRHPSSDPALAIRFEMWRVGWRMMRRRPLVGVGPGNIAESYPIYLPPGTAPMVGYHDHLHDNFIQLGAERGLPCLAAWIWLMGALVWQIFKIRRRLASAPEERAQLWVADAALAAWLAFMAEGCFEFNFGASPVLMVFLFVMSASFAASRVN